MKSIDTVDAIFISKTVFPVISTDKRELAKLRALLRIDSHLLVRQIEAQKLLARKDATEKYTTLRDVVRQRARTVQDNLPRVKGFVEQVGE